MPGYDGRGVEIALLDTGVDRSQPYLGGRVRAGIDVLDANDTADAQPNPQNPNERERHGTELAGLLVGAGGPGGIHGAAPGATVLPVRVAGWQPDSTGRDAVYARSDQLIAGLDRAVDPNGDGDTHDAARIALIGVSEPYAAFADSPEALAVAGARSLDTLVVAPAGNEGIAGPVFGSLDGPGGAPAALTVAAIDPRRATASVHLSVWHGLDVTFDARLPLLGTIVPPHALDLAIGVPHGDGEQVSDYFDRHGLGLVAGRAALVHAGPDPGAAAVAASEGGARAVLVYGGNLPAGSLGLSSDVGVPVVAIPAAAAHAILAGLRHGGHVGVALGRARSEPNPLAGRIASFSSRGLAFGGALKPDLAAPGIGLATSDPGSAPDGEPEFATVNGTSAAAASVAGAAAVLAQVRPDLGAADLASLLAGSARPAVGSFAAWGAGLVDVGASATGEVAASATSLSFGPPGLEDADGAQRLDAAADRERSRRTADARRAAPPRAARRAFGAHSRHRACTRGHRGHTRAEPARRAAPPRALDRRAAGARGQPAPERVARPHELCSVRHDTGGVARAGGPRRHGERREDRACLAARRSALHGGGRVRRPARARARSAARLVQLRRHRPVAHRRDARARPLPVAPCRLADAWRCSQQADRLLRDSLKRDGRADAA